MPALLIDGEAVLDSVAIIQFLADRHGRFTFPAGTIERARQDSFTQFAVDELEGACWNHAKHSFVLPEELRTPSAKSAFAHDFATALKTLEKRLSDNPFVMGETFTVPDLVIGHVAGWGLSCGYEWPAGRLGDYFERLRSRPAFLRAKEAAKAG